MTLESLYQLLESTGLPVVYRAWPIDGAPELPYICYLSAYSNNFSADGVVYQPIDHVQIELYTKDKNPEAEGRVESALSSIFWEKSETYIDTEQCYQILYEVEV